MFLRLWTRAPRTTILSLEASDIRIQEAAIQTQLRMGVSEESERPAESFYYKSGELPVRCGTSHTNTARSEMCVVAKRQNENYGDELGVGVALDGLKEVLVLEQDLDRANNLAAGVLRNRTFESGMRRLCRQFFGNLLDGEQQQRGVWQIAGDFTRGLQSIHLRHSQIEHDYVWTQLGRFVDSVLTIVSIAADTQTKVVFDQAAQKAPDGGIIVGDEDADCHNLGSGREVRSRPLSRNGEFSTY